MADADYSAWTLPKGVEQWNAYYLLFGETLLFPYYAVKDLFVRDCFEAKVTYDEQGIASKKNYY